VAQYAESFANTPRIMQFADLDSLKFQRYAASSRRLMKWVYATEGHRLLKYERHIAATFSYSLVCTETEQRDFERLIPGHSVSTVGNGVDLEFFRTKKADKNKAEIIFTGVMDYIPNVDAVVWFCDEILPLVQKRIAGARFVICGSRPSPTVLRLADRPGVTVTGRVEDIRPYLDRAEVFVAPLRIARGIQNKVVEALAMNLPVVASSAACAGTAIPAGEGILAADEPVAFARHIVRLLEDDEFRAAMSLRARIAVARDFAWETQLAKLHEVIVSATAGSLRSSPHSDLESRSAVEP
jgi:sugar transferase (PEP-CTERM/EpsH1 system associated)